MKNHPFRNRPGKWLIGIVTLVIVLACSGSPSAVTQIVEVTKVIPVTQVIQAKRFSPATQVIRATRFVPVTRFIPVTRIVPVTQIVEAPPAIPLPTQAPIEMVPPAATEAPTAILIPRSSATPLKPSYDLLTWYDFEDDFLSSGVVTDRSGNGYDAQLNGSLNLSDGISGGRSIFFYGDGFILTRDNPAAGRNAVSFSLWFRTDHPEENFKLASAAWWGGGPGSGWILATHCPEFWSEDTQSIFAGGIENQDNGFRVGEWNHEVVTYDGKRLQEYTNGQLINDWQATGAPIGQGQALAVGAWPQFGFNFQGSIDEFQIYARSLTRQEVQSLYHQGP